MNIYIPHMISSYVLFIQIKRLCKQTHRFSSTVCAYAAYLTGGRVLESVREHFFSKAMVVAKEIYILHNQQQQQQQQQNTTKHKPRTISFRIAKF